MHPTAAGIPAESRAARKGRTRQRTCLQDRLLDAMDDKRNSTEDDPAMMVKPSRDEGCFQEFITPPTTSPSTEKPAPSECKQDPGQFRRRSVRRSKDLNLLRSDSVICVETSWTGYQSQGNICTESLTPHFGQTMHLAMLAFLLACHRYRIPLHKTPRLPHNLPGHQSRRAQRQEEDRLGAARNAQLRRRVIFRPADQPPGVIHQDQAIGRHRAQRCSPD